MANDFHRRLSRLEGARQCLPPLTEAEIESALSRYACELERDGERGPSVEAYEQILRTSPMAQGLRHASPADFWV